MYLYLPIALTSINILVPVGLGLAVGLLSGLFGVGGGFLMTPRIIRTKAGGSPESPRSRAYA